MRGAGLVGGRIVGSSGIFFWVWTFIALGVTAVFSLILSARGLWSLRRGQPPRSTGSDERQMGREAAGGEASRAVAGSKLFGGVAEGADEETVGFVERPAGLAAPSVETRRR